MSIDSISEMIALLANKTLAHNYRWAENSIIDQERKTLCDDKAIGNSIALISLFFDACIQHLSGYLLNLKNIFPVAAYSCFRSYLETAALCAWLSDPKIKAAERLARQLTLRIHEQKYFVKPFMKEADYEMLKKQNIEKITALSEEGREFGLEPKLDKKINIIGVNGAMPKISDLIDDYFELKHYYSFLSNIVHGHHTEMITAGGSVGKMVNNDSMELVPISREVKSDLVENLEVCIKNSFGIVLDSIWELFGWLPNELNFAELEMNHSSASQRGSNSSKR